MKTNVAINVKLEGDMRICCNDYNSKIIFGNIKDERIIDIWNNEEYKTIRTKLLSGYFENKALYFMPVVMT
jgi:hypothetical protein